VFSLIIFLLTAVAYAKDFGRQGETFFIAEEHLLIAMQNWMEKNGSFDVTAEELIAPLPVAELSKATRVRSFPLNLSISHLLLFFDATDPEQLAWAKRQSTDAIWILVKGDPLALGVQENREVFFDQGGMLTSRFQIRHVPACVRPQEEKVLVEEGEAS
jgi:hypothetical protein